VVPTALRCCPALVDEFSKWIEADRGSEAFESAPMNAVSIRSDVSRLVLWALIAMSFFSAGADGLIVQQMSPAIASCS
jgi:hypothetical protein